MVPPTTHLSIKIKNTLKSAAILLLLSSSSSSPVSAAPYAQRLTQYGHTAWHVQDGLFNSPNSITQTKDGYLWLGTDAGLVRFDGVRFVPWNSFSDGSIATWAIYRVLAARDGSLWIATTARVAQVRDRRISRYENSGRAVDMVEDDSGAVWFARTRVYDGTGPACSVSHGKLVCYGKPDIPYPFAGSIGQSNGGGFWLGSSYGLCHWLPGQAAECYLQDALRPLNGLTGANALLTTRDGTLWVGMGRPGKDLGLGRFVRGKWEPVEAKGLDPSTLSVTKLIEDREGSVWVGTLDQGLYRIRAGVAEHFGASDGLSGNAVTDIYEDREGIIWMSTSDGLDSFRRLAVSVFSTREGLPANDVEAVLPARDGSIWIGNSVLSRLVADVPQPPPQPHLFRQRAVTSLLEDGSGRLWIGLNNTLNVFSQGELKSIKSGRGSDLGMIWRLVQDPQNDIWAMTPPVTSHIFRIRDRAVVEQFDPKILGAPFAVASDPVNGVWFGYASGAIAHYHDGQLEKFAADPATGIPIRELLPEVDGTVLAASDRGLIVQRGSTRQLLDAEHGLPCEPTFSVLRDLKNSVWLVSSCGLIEIPAAEFARWRAAPKSKIQTKVFDATDGVQSGHADFTPSAKMDRDGRLWFATQKVAQMIDPAEVAAPLAPPPTRVEQIVADRKTFPSDGTITLPLRTRDVEIQYTAPSFAGARKIQFRYRLDGRDKTWEDAGARRAAYYTDLPPAQYTFHVMASNNEGAWPDTEATVIFTIPPTFIQTKWFLASCIAAGAAALWLLMILRFRQIQEKFRDRIEERRSERERIARDLHDTLLQGVQGLVFTVQAAAKGLPPGDVNRDRLEDALTLADKALEEGRNNLAGLRGLGSESRDIFATLTALGQLLASDRSAKFHSVSEGQPRELHPVVREEAYRIMAEALSNAFRHAKAGAIELEVRYESAGLAILIRDDGVGIDQNAFADPVKADHFGIIGMRERAAKINSRLEIFTRRGTGTEAYLRVPATMAYRSPAPVKWLARLFQRRHRARE
jgi:signal transduction histidine kinase/ligand-binding sensor domain-containing protein